MGVKMKTSEALYAAGDHMAAFGHCPDSAYNMEYIGGGGSIATAPSCIIGSVHQTVGYGKESLPILEALDAYVAPLDIVTYNATHTAEEVVAAFRAAAVIEEAKENAEVLEPVA